MIKKIIIRLLVAVGICALFFSMIFLKSLKPSMLKAYSINETNYNGYSFQFDKSLYYDDNLLDVSSISGVYCGVTFSQDNESVINVNGTANSYCEVTLWKGSISDFTFYTFTDENLNDSSVYMRFSNASTHYYHFNEGHYYSSNNLTSLVIGFGTGQNFNNFKLKLMAVSGNNNFTEYHQYFKFGYNMGYSFFITNNGSQVYNERISVNDASSGIVPYPEIFSSSCYIPVGQQEHCYSGRHYFAFDIDDNGYVFSNRVFAVGIPLASNLSIVAKDSGLFFEPVFQGTLKNGGVAGIYSKYIYTYNSFLFNSFQTIVTGNNVNSQLVLSGNDWDNSLVFNENVNNINYITDWRSDTNTSNNFSSSIFNQLYQFSLSYGRTSYLGSLRFGVSFSGINLLIVDDTSGGFAPVPGGNFENYNTCSAWYDIPCQAGNALTYVIYNAPIISPVVSFISGFVFIIQKFVELIQVFASLGVIFYIFILLLFLYILTKFSK